MQFGSCWTMTVESVGTGTALGSSREIYPGVVIEQSLVESSSHPALLKVCHAYIDNMSVVF